MLTIYVIIYIQGGGWGGGGREGKVGGLIVAGCFVPEEEDRTCV